MENTKGLKRQMKIDEVLLRAMGPGLSGIQSEKPGSGLNMKRPSKNKAITVKIEQIESIESNGGMTAPRSKSGGHRQGNPNGREVNAKTNGGLSGYPKDYVIEWGDGVGRPKRLPGTVMREDNEGYVDVTNGPVHKLPEPRDSPTGGSKRSSRKNPPKAAKNDREKSTRNPALGRGRR